MLGVWDATHVGRIVAEKLDGRVLQMELEKSTQIFGAAKPRGPIDSFPASQCTSFWYGTSCPPIISCVPVLVLQRRPSIRQPRFLELVCLSNDIDCSMTASVPKDALDVGSAVSLH